MSDYIQLITFVKKLIGASSRCLYSFHDLDILTYGVHAMNDDRIKHKTIVEQVMKKIQDLIVTGEFRVSDRIPTENALAERFGVGRSSVREAIKVFNYLGVLESKPAKGTFICETANISKEALTWSILLGKNDLRELIEIRGAIEIMSIVKITERYKKDPDLVADLLQMLEAQVEIMKKASIKTSKKQLIEADYNFHHTIILGSKNNLFVSIYQSLKSFMFEEINKSYKYVLEEKTIEKDHREIVSTIRTGDRIKAARVILRHIDLIEQRFGID